MGMAINRAMFGYGIGMVNGSSVTATPTAGSHSFFTSMLFDASSLEDAVNQTAEGLVVFGQVWS